jgi:anti-anti-sigma regulatory factor
VVKRKRASHEDVLDLQVKVLKGKLEEQNLNKLKLQLQIDMLKKYSSNEYTISSSQLAFLSSMV